MGSLELQLMRELAIDLVRQCAERVLREGSEAPADLAWYRQWFADQYERWLVTPRPALSGRTPLNAIADERHRLGIGPADLSDVPQQIELYTDLPQIEHWGEPAATAGAASSSLAPGDALPARWTADPAEHLADRGAASSADDARWQRFCEQHLAGWLED
ncbi:MAG: hypothetical protein IT340_02870 [Chloroflexi bacterium]|nr:hypothetical protein [Chloroflexota bacterium]